MHVRNPNLKNTLKYKFEEKGPFINFFIVNSFISFYYIKYIYNNYNRHYIYLVNLMVFFFNKFVHNSNLN